MVFWKQTIRMAKIMQLVTQIEFSDSGLTMGCSLLGNIQFTDKILQNECVQTHKSSLYWKLSLPNTARAVMELVMLDMWHTTLKSTQYHYHDHTSTCCTVHRFCTSMFTSFWDSAKYMTLCFKQHCSFHEYTANIMFNNVNHTDMHANIHCACTHELWCRFLANRQCGGG